MLSLVLKYIYCIYKIVWNLNLRSSNSWLSPSSYPGEWKAFSALYWIPENETVVLVWFWISICSAQTRLNPVQVAFVERLTKLCPSPQAKIFMLSKKGKQHVGSDFQQGIDSWVRLQWGRRSVRIGLMVIWRAAHLFVWPVSEGWGWRSRRLGP